MFAAKVANELVGAMDVPGGDQNTQAWGPVLKPTEDGTVTPIMEGIGTAWKFPPDDVQLSSFFPYKHSSPYLAWRVILDPKKYYLPYDVEMIVNYGSNPFVSNAAPKEPLEAYKKVPFVVGIAYHFDEPTVLADIVLPETSNYECYMVSDVGGPDSKGLWTPLVPKGVAYRFPVVQKLYNTNQCEEIFLELANRMKMASDPKAGLIARINTTLASQARVRARPGQDLYSVGYHGSGPQESVRCRQRRGLFQANRIPIRTRRSQDYVQLCRLPDGQNPLPDLLRPPEGSRRQVEGWDPKSRRQLPWLGPGRGDGPLSPRRCIGAPCRSTNSPPNTISTL